jgi:hypothetical protein
MQKKVDSFCGLVVRVPSYRMEMYCVSCVVRTEFICYVVERKKKREERKKRKNRKEKYNSKE